MSIQESNLNFPTRAPAISYFADRVEYSLLPHPAPPLPRVVEDDWGRVTQNVVSTVLRSW